MKFTSLALLLPLLVTSFSNVAALLKPSIDFNSQRINQTVANALAEFNTPGMAVGVVHQNKVIHLKGYGVTDYLKRQPVNEFTQFRLASVTKAFTAASLAMLVDEGKINWQDKVTDYLPEFKMQQHWVTGEFTIKDLLTHQSGLVSGAGDSMLWPEPSGFSRKEIITNLQYLTPEYSFRSQYAYSNVMYITAGELVAKVTNMSWEDFVDSRILKPLNMLCFAGDMPTAKLNNIAIPHGDKDGEMFYIHRNGIHGVKTVSAAAGGMVCNASSMVNWMTMLLNKGQNQDGEQLISEEQIALMWQPHTILPISEDSKDWDNTFFRTYGLGWRQHNMHGHRVISHTGTLSGMQAYIVLVPSLELGVIVLNNGSNWGARTAVMQSVVKSFLPQLTVRDWVATITEIQQQDEQEYLDKYVKPSGSNQVIKPINTYVGDYTDTWFGTMRVAMQEGKLRISSSKMSKLIGTLQPFNDHTFVARWDDSNAANDAFVHFSLDVNGLVTGFNMHPYTVKQKTNHEWRDMSFIKEQQ